MTPILKETNIDQSINSYDDINKMFDTSYRPKPFTSFEKTIFNSEFKDEDFDLENVEIVNSLANYYDIYKEIEKHLFYANKLIELNDSRGHLKLGNYYLGKENFEMSILHFKLGAEMGNVLAMGNLGVIYSNPDKGNYDFDLAKKYLDQAILCLFVPAFFRLARLYIMAGNNIEGQKCLFLGVKNGCKTCLDVIEATTFETKTKLYIFLTNIRYSNDMIRKRIKEITPWIDQKQVDSERGDQFFLNVDDTILVVDEFGDLVDFVEGETAEALIDFVGISNERKKSE